MKRSQQISSSVDSLDPPKKNYMALKSLRSLFTELHPVHRARPGMISLLKKTWSDGKILASEGHEWSLPFGDKLKGVSMDRVFASLDVTICDIMRVVALCDYMSLYVTICDYMSTGLFVVYIYIYIHSTWLFVSVKLAILQFTWQYVTVQRLLPCIMSRVHIDEIGNGLLCRVWGAKHLGPERLCKWHVASPHVDILGIWQGYVYIYIYICNMHA